MYIMNLITIQQNAAFKSKFLAHENAAVMFLSTTKYKNAAIFHNLIVKHTAVT
jgi:hypothetical protein